MSILQIKKLESGTFKHVDSIDGDFFLGRFSFKQELNKAFLVEAYGAKRREYLIGEIKVFDYLGVEETFLLWDDLFNRLTELGYTGIETNGIIPVGNYLSDDPSEYVDAILPLTGTEVALLNDGVSWVQITWNNIKAQLKSYFDTIYAPIGGGGGSTDYVSYFSPRAFIDFPLNDWQCSGNGNANAQFFGGGQVSCGTGATPNTNLGVQAVLLPIPSGYIVEEIIVNLNYKAFNTTTSTMQFFVQREETNGTAQVSTGSNAITICNDTLVTTTGTTANTRVFKSLSINSHSLPSLAFSYLQLAIRETQNASYNALSLEIRFKKP